MTLSIAVNAPPKKNDANDTLPQVSESVFRQRTLPYSEAPQKEAQATQKPPIGYRHISQ